MSIYNIIILVLIMIMAFIGLLITVRSTSKAGQYYGLYIAIGSIICVLIKCHFFDVFLS